jgi:hypothetical protein
MVPMGQIPGSMDAIVDWLNAIETNPFVVWSLESSMNYGTIVRTETDPSPDE